MSDPLQPLPPSDPQHEIRMLLEEIRKQNQLLKRYLFVFGAGLSILLLMQFEVIKYIVQQILSYAIIVCIVLAVLLTAPFWSQLVIYITDRLPGFAKRNGHDGSHRR